MRLTSLPLALFLLPLSACAMDHDPMTFTQVGDQIIATGTIDADSADAFLDMVDAHPEVTTLVLSYVGGSVDDDANVEFVRLVRDSGFATHVPGDGLVASGGTDLFLAGVTRTADAGACIGVHAWAAGDFTANDLPRDDPEHDRYLALYDDIGIDQAFYWFTLGAAPAEGMHWMTAAEATQFAVTTRPSTDLGTKAQCDDR